MLIQRKFTVRTRLRGGKANKEPRRHHDALYFVSDNTELVVVGGKERATASGMDGQMGGRVTELRLYTKFKVTRGRGPGFGKKAQSHSDSVPGRESQDG